MPKLKIILTRQFNLITFRSTHQLNKYLTMKRLILHPDDRSTDFLKPIYSQLKNTTVITGGLRRQSEIHELIQSHDQVIMLGHGFSEGLCSVRQFGLNPFIIDARSVKYLSKKESNIFIWCYASDFVSTHKLRGYCSGMFISEELEALYHNVEASEDQINLSNDVFAAALGEALLRGHSMQETFEHVYPKYEAIAEGNLVVKYNLERLRWF